AMRIAMEKSPSMRHSRLNLERSESSLRAAQARLKSKFSLSLTPLNYSNFTQFNDLFSTWYTQETLESFGTFRVEQPIKWTDGKLSLINRLSYQDAYSEFQDKTSKTYTNNLYISFQQPIFTYNKTKMELRNLELDLEDNQLSYSLQKLSIEKLVMEQFFAVYQNKMRVDIAREAYANTRTSYDISKNKVDAGLESLDDLYQSELNMANAQSSLQNQQVTLENSLDRFKQLLGIPLQEEIDITADVSYRHVPVDLQTALSHGLRHRMELRQRQIDIRMAEDELIQTGAQNEFAGNLNLSYGSIGTNETFNDIYRSPDKNQQFSLTLEIPLWDWGEKKSLLQASRASLNSRKLSLDEETDQIMISIRETYRNLDNQVIQIEIARQNVRRSQLTYDINLEKYRNGDLSSMLLNDYQNQLSEAKLNEVAALIQYKLGLLDMKIQSLWDFENDTPVIK
ncbi:MAG: TolC family protein, partial [Candidatus Krumholzibacteriota bacterium]|nr:TolC family protein [Candidatus Krumholzibacteriota bacterium]